MVRRVQVTLGTGSTTSPVTSTGLSGVYYGNTPAKSTIDGFQSWRGVQPITLNSIFVQDSQWTDITNPDASSLTPGILTLAKAELDAGRAVDIALPPFPKNTGLSKSTLLANAAAGTYDPNWNLFIDKLVAAGVTSNKVTIRFAWEMNGSFMNWFVSNTTDLANYQAMWQRFTGLLRARTQCLMFFCPNNTHSGTSPQPDAIYPGNAYVDVYGIDVYNQWFSGGAFPTGGTQAQQDAWRASCRTFQITTTWGVNAHLDFAASIGKPFALGEWGCITRPDGFGGTDDPAWVQTIWDALHTTAPARGVVVYGQSYFNSTSSSGYTKLDPGTTYVNAPPVYQATFGSSA